MQPVKSLPGGSYLSYFRSIDIEEELKITDKPYGNLCADIRYCIPLHSCILVL